MINIDKKLIEKMIYVYGADKQLVVCMEEMGELIQQLSKQIRGIAQKCDVAEELADVYICLETIKSVCKIKDDALNQVIRWKQERTQKRLDAKSENINDYVTKIYTEEKTEHCEQCRFWGTLETAPGKKWIGCSCTFEEEDRPWPCCTDEE